MALSRPQNQLELAELTAALSDDEGNIRWLASSTLVNLGGLAVVKMLAAYLQTDPSLPARQEVRRIAGLLAETSEDEAVKAEVELLLRS